ncbi:hypothetical protein ACS0TY_034730 [Phlomoides rotata]
MSCVVWNARGLGGRRAFLNLKRLVDDFAPLFVFISETKIRSTVGKRIASSLNFPSCFYVDPRGRSGGLLLMWSEDVSVVLRSYSRGHIDCGISYLNSKWRFSGFYGNPVQHLRQFSWDLLRRIFSIKQTGNEPWLVGATSMKYVLILKRKVAIC